MDQWIGFEVKSTLGASGNAKWSLRVQLPGGKAKIFQELPYGSTTFKKLMWIGFTSGATKKTVFYMDDFHLSPGR